LLQKVGRIKEVPVGLFFFHSQGADVVMLKVSRKRMLLAEEIILCFVIEEIQLSQNH